MEEYYLENNENKNGKILCIISAIFLSLYIFGAHFNYPFYSTYFLYISLASAVIVLVMKLRLTASKSLAIYIYILLYTFMGTLYSNNVVEGNRQTVFFLIYLAFYWLAMQDNIFLKAAKKFFYWFAFAGMITVYLQFFFQTPFNLLIARVFRSDVYESVMWSYNVDGTFTGLTQSVSLASFSMAIVFFVAIQNALNLHFERGIDLRFQIAQKHPGAVKIINYAIAFIAMFGIILTSKRGIFLASILALIVTLVLDKDVSFKHVTRVQFIVGMIAIAILLSIGMYFISTNDYITAFVGRFSGSNITTGRNVFYENALSDFSQGDLLTYLFGKGTGAAYLINSTGLHNVYLQILYDHGILGIILYVAFFVSNVKNAIQNRYFYSMCLQIMFLAYCMSGNPLYDYYFFIPYLIYSCDKE